LFKADTDSLLKLLPEFIQEFKVPLVAIADASHSVNRTMLFFQNQRSLGSSNLAPYFDPDWVFSTGQGRIKDQHVFPKGLPKSLKED
jgi:hypothetical protein